MSVERKNTNITQPGNAAIGIPVMEGTAGEGSVDRIRDILFGNQMQDYERQLGGLEDRIMKEIALVRENSASQFNALEDCINRELESLSERLQAEQSHRMKAEKKLAVEMTENSRLLVEKLAKLEIQLDDSYRDLGQQILNQSKALSEEIGRKYDEAHDALDQTTGELQKQAVNRATLSGLLAEFAERLAENPAPQSDLDKETG